MDKNDDKESIELTIVLPLLGKDLSLESVLKLLPIDIKEPYEFIIVYVSKELGPSTVKHISAKYKNVRWLEKNTDKSTLGALKQGIDVATGKYILMLCADIAGPIITINQMLNLAREGCDFVGCTRYAAGGRRLGDFWFETILSQLANILLQIAGCAFTDATLGLKLFRKDIFPQLKLQSNSTGWVIAFEMALKSQFNNLRLGEVATIAVDRMYGGYSSRNYAKHFFEYVKWFFWGCIKLQKTTTKTLSVPTCTLQISE